MSDELDAPSSSTFGWDVAHLLNLGVILSTPGFSVRLDSVQVQRLLDLIASKKSDQISDYFGKKISVSFQNEHTVLTRDEDSFFPNGIILDSSVIHDLKNFDPEDEFDILSSGSKINNKITESRRIVKITRLT